MIDLTSVPSDVLLARGEYATVRGAHEDAKKALQIHTGALSSIASKVLRQMQPDGDDVPGGIEALLMEGRATLDKIEAECLRITSLACQRADLKPKAWPK